MRLNATRGRFCLLADIELRALRRILLCLQQRLDLMNGSGAMQQLLRLPTSGTHVSARLLVSGTDEASSASTRRLRSRALAFGSADSRVLVGADV
eukprot:6197973-Pleurochrysis_carterae.AAC.7